MSKTKVPTVGGVSIFFGTTQFKISFCIADPEPSTPRSGLSVLLFVQSGPWKTSQFT